MREHDSDEDEGFVPTKVQIKQDEDCTVKKIDDNKQRPIDFQGRYIYGQGIFRKEPPETYARFQNYLTNQQPVSNDSSVRVREEAKHPYEKYINSNDYTLVYSRYKDKMVFSPDSDDFTSNEMNLEKVLSAYNKDNYSMLKNFEMPPEQQQEQQLQFDSRYQGGNLMYAFKSKGEQNSYTLFLQNDTNTYGYNQWFYFSLRFAKPNTKYNFKIVNFRKKHSFFKQSLKLAVFSRQQALNHGSGWFKAGHNIKYQRAPIKKLNDKKFKFYSLNFDLTFQHPNDYISIAMNLPYTYSRLIHNMKICEELALKSNQIEWRRQIVGHSIGNNAIPYLTITSKSPLDSQEGEQNENQGTQKKVIIILARQHPGETWSSFFMEQILYYLAQNHSNNEVSAMLDQYIFKIFPMVNVDGVIYGNSRCDLGGFDLNRTWKYPDRTLHPQVCSIKQQIQRINEQYNIQCVFDLHGHSKQYNIFCYSCKNDNITCRVLPYMISKINPMYHFPFCTFGLSKYKETTARAVIYHLTGNQNVLTIESSFFGGKINEKLVQFAPVHFKEMSASLFQALIDYLKGGNKKKQARNQLQGNIRQILSYERKYNENGGDSGSQSDPLADQISIKQKLKKILPKTLITTLTQKLQENPIQPKKKSTKKKMQKKTVIIDKRKYETIIPKVQKIKEEEQIRPKKNFLERTSLTHYKKQSKQLPIKNNKGIPGSFSQESSRNNELLDSEVPFRPDILKNNTDALPFYLRDKPRLVPIKLKNDSLQMFKEAYEFQKKQKKEDGEQSPYSKSSVKNRSRPIKIVKRSIHQQKQQFPLLCVLSESKKKTHMDKYANLNSTKTNKSSYNKYTNRSQLQQISSKQLSSNTIDNHVQNTGSSQKKMFRTYVQNEKLERLKKNSQRQKNKDKVNQNATLISKVWRDNVARYGKNLNIFLGDMKGI